MDWTGLITEGTTLLKKYRYAILLIMVGIVFILIPGNSESNIPVVTSDPAQPSQPTMEERLCNILGMIDGIGKVEVLLTQAQGETIIYQTDDNISSDTQSADRRSDTVLITGSDRLETGLIKQINPALYRGAVVVCQGAEDPAVCLAVVEAVRCVTGLTSDKITVLKMK